MHLVIYIYIYIYRERERESEKERERASNDFVLSGCLDDGMNSPMRKL